MFQLKQKEHRKIKTFQKNLLLLRMVRHKRRRLSTTTSNTWNLRRGKPCRTPQVGDKSDIIQKSLHFLMETSCGNSSPSAPGCGATWTSRNFFLCLSVFLVLGSPFPLDPCPLQGSSLSMFKLKSQICVLWVLSPWGWLPAVLEDCRAPHLSGFHFGIEMLILRRAFPVRISLPIVELPKEDLISSCSTEPAPEELVLLTLGVEEDLSDKGVLLSSKPAEGCPGTQQVTLGQRLCLPLLPPWLLGKLGSPAPISLPIFPLNFCFPTLEGCQPEIEKGSL